MLVSDHAAAASIVNLQQDIVGKGFLMGSVFKVMHDCSFVKPDCVAPPIPFSYCFFLSACVLLHGADVSLYCIYQHQYCEYRRLFILYHQVALMSLFSVCNNFKIAANATTVMPEIFHNGGS